MNDTQENVLVRELTGVEMEAVVGGVHDLDIVPGG